MASKKANWALLLSGFYLFVFTLTGSFTRSNLIDETNNRESHDTILYDKIEVLEQELQGLKARLGNPIGSGKTGVKSGPMLIIPPGEYIVRPKTKEAI